LTSWLGVLSYRIKLIVFFAGAIAVLFALNAAYSALNTISRLNAVEAERDRWQRPSEVVQALDLRPGNVVVDVGCGAGYFALKLSGPVGDRGRVVAEDVRRLPLVFLWLRTVTRHESNVSLVHGDLNDPRLPAHVNSVIISNTYHVMSLQTRLRSSFVFTSRWFRLDAWLSLIARRGQPTVPLRNRLNTRFQRITSKVNFARQNLRSSVDKTVSLGVIPITRVGG
jgi:hypothetical protein